MSTRLPISNVLFQFNCCGLDGPSDYDGWKTPFPETCCPKTDRACTKRSADVYIEGCRTAVPNFFKDNAYILGGIAVGIGLIQVSFFRKTRIEPI